MKKKLLMAGMVLTAMSLVACGGGKSADKSGGNETVTVEFMHSSVEQERLDVINKLVANFEAANKGIKIKQIPVEEDAFNTKVVTLARSGELPSVLEVSQDFAKVMDKDELVDQKAIKDVIKTVGEENYYDGVKRLARSEKGDSYITVPLSGWVQGVWYDKDLLSGSGFEEPKNWEDLLKIAKHFTDAGQKKYGIAMPTAASTMSEQAFSQFALSNQANVLDKAGEITIDTPEMEDALAFYQELAAYTMPGSNDVTEIKDAFMNGTVPMAIYSTYLLPSIYEENRAETIGFAIPNNKEQAVYGTVSGLSISAGLDEAEKQATKKFVAFLSEPENMATWVLMSPAGAQPVNKKVVDLDVYQSNKVIQAFGDLPAEIASSFDEIQVFGLVGDKNFTKMGDITSSGILGKTVNEVTVGKGDVEKALKTAQEKSESQK